jgi:hypothetical protein
MSVNTKVFQIYFKNELAAHCDPLFTPLDNTDNPRPELREWDVWNRNHEAVLEQKLDYWGYVSWKFKEKTNLTSQQVFDFINNNPGHDVYLFNPCIINEAVFVNSWEQGDLHHQGISTIGQKFLNKVGYGEHDLRSIMLDRNRTVFANYVVGNQKFWTRFMEFSRKLFTEAEKDAEFKDEVFGAGRSNYAHDQSLPNFTFLIERLIPTFLELEEFDSIGFSYDKPELAHDKYHPYLTELRILSDLKVLINRYESDDLYNIWHLLRQKFLQQYTTSILGLE